MKRPTEIIHCDCDCEKKTLIEEFNETSFRPYVEKIYMLSKTEDSDIFMQMDFIDKTYALSLPDAVRNSHIVYFAKQLCKKFEACIKNEKNIPFPDRMTISRRTVFTIPNLGTGSTNDKREKNDLTFKADINALSIMHDTLMGVPATILPPKKEIYIAFQEAISNTLEINHHYASSISGDILMKKVNILSKNCRELMHRKMF